MVSSGSGASQTDDQSDIKPTDEEMKLTDEQGKLPSRELFPFLSKHLCQVNSSGDTSSDTESSNMMKPYSMRWESHVSNRSFIKQKLSYPSTDHTYSIPEEALEDALASSDKSSSVDEGLDCGSESEEDNVAEDYVESDNISDINMANDTQSASSVSIGSDQSECTAEIVDAVQTEEMLPAAEEKQTMKTDERDDQEKRNFFAAMALIEMSSSAPQKTLPKKISKRRRILPAKLKEASESVKKPSGPRVKVSGRRRKASENSLNAFPIDDKVSGKRKRLTDDNGGDDASAVNQQDSSKRPKRMQKRLLPINSSLWGVRRKLPDLDSSLESPPKKQIAVKRQTVAKKQPLQENKESQDLEESDLQASD